MIYRICLPLFAPNYVKFDPWVWHKKKTQYFPVLPRRVLGLSYAPLKFSNKKNVMATPPKPFDGIP